MIMLWKSFVNNSYNFCKYDISSKVITSNYIFRPNIRQIFSSESKPLAKNSLSYSKPKPVLTYPTNDYHIRSPLPICSLYKLFLGIPVFFSMIIFIADHT